MGVNTNITFIFAIKTKILQNTEILAKSPAAILNHDVNRHLNAKIAPGWHFSYLFTSYLFSKTQNLKVIQIESICSYTLNKNKAKKIRFLRFFGHFFYKIAHRNKN